MNMIPVSSSNLSAVGYDEKSKTLFITFHKTPSPSPCCLHCARGDEHLVWPSAPWLCLNIVLGAVSSDKQRACLFCPYGNHH